MVDNASTDKTAEIARGLRGVTVIREDKKGANNARQKGFEAASGEFIAYIDADCMISPNWIQTAEKYLSHPNVLLLNGPVFYHDAPPWLGRLTWAVQWIVLPISHLLMSFLIGGNFIVRRSALEAVGGFDCGIAFYGDDANLAKRLKGRGSLLFKMDFWVYTSARRLMHEGFVKAYIRYALNTSWQSFFRRSFTEQYTDVR